MMSKYLYLSRMATKSIFIFFLVLSTVSFSQSDSCQYQFSGKLLDIDTKDPIPFATVKIQGSEKGTQTDGKGQFILENLCEEEHTLIISCFGYCDSICEANHQHGSAPPIYLHKKVEQLDKVIIEAEEIKERGTESIAQTDIDKIEIKKDRTKSLASLISDQQGVTLISMGSNVQLPVIHGLYGNRILILNNGFKHGFQNWGREHAPEIDISSADNITVVKGAAGVRFGAEALGGAIIVNANPLHFRESLYADVGAGFQTNGQGINTNIEVGAGLDKWSYFINGNFTKIGDRFAPDYSLTNTGKEERAFSAGTRFKHKKIDVKLYYSYVDQNLGMLRSSIAHSGNAFVLAINGEQPTFIKPFSYEINAPNQLTTHHLGKVEANWHYKKDSKLTFRSGFQLNKRQEYDIRIESEKPVIDLNLITTDYQLEWKHPDWFKLDGIIGIQYFNQNNDNNPGTGATPFIPNYNTNRGSFYVLESKKLERTSLEAGIRIDYELNNVRGREPNQEIFRDEYAFTNVTSSAGLVRHLTENSTFRFNIGTAWRTPNMAELYSFGQHGFKTSFGLLRYYQNEEGIFKTDRVLELVESGAKPENGYKLINELEVRTKKTKHVFTPYMNYIRNFIFDRPLAVIGTVRGPMPVFIFDQTDAIFIGADYSFVSDFSEDINGVFRISYLWSKNIKDNEVLINQPPISLNYRLNWNKEKLWIFENSRLSITQSYTFHQFQAPRTVPPEDLISGIESVTPNSEIFDFKDAPEGYFLLNLSLHTNYRNLKLGINATNLLNTDYRDYLNEMRYFADEPGTNVMFTLNYSFKKR